MSLLSVIIVNYKQPQLAIDCLASIGGAEHMEIIVVDNDSGDDSRERICRQFPNVHWIQMEYNSGFARGNNAGIRVAQGNIVLLLNSDTINEGNAIRECFDRLAPSDYIGAGVQLLNDDRSPQVSGNYFMKGGLNHLMVLPYTGRLLRGMAIAFGVKKTNVPEAKGLVEVDWINGAFLMVKREAIDKAGLLDEDFFLFSEEIEWCHRLRKAGKFCIYGDLHVVHLQGASSKNAFNSKDGGYSDLSDHKGYQVMLSGLVRIRKQFGIGWFIIHMMAYFFTIILTIPVVIIHSLIASRWFGKIWRNWLGFAANYFRVWSQVFRILRNRPHFYKVL